MEHLPEGLCEQMQWRLPVQPFLIKIIVVARPTNVSHSAIRWLPIVGSTCIFSASARSVQYVEALLRIWCVIIRYSISKVCRGWHCCSGWEQDRDGGLQSQGSDLDRMLHTQTVFRHSVCPDEIQNHVQVLNHQNMQRMASSLKAG